ncbi:MAG: glycerate kinase [Clostridia bacterium]|nr:glycerate kinase [Clostridia bacterium]
MKVTIAIDSFKGSLSSMEAGRAVRDGISRVYEDSDIHIHPIADGGEGTVDAIVSSLGGEVRTVSVSGPLGENVDAFYGIIKESKTAIMEMSSAAGITLIDESQRNPMNTTTYGVGQMIKDAIESGCRNFVIGIGGSATNDGGIGMLQALGFEFLDSDGNQISTGAKGLEDLRIIKTEKSMKELLECRFSIACDVKNPLCGELGCSRVFAPQKGADEKMIEKMDKWLGIYADMTKEVLPESDKDIPGTGAAGGLGFAFMAYLGGNLVSGIELVMKESKLEDYIKNSDIVVTGEGRLDGQSHMGKAPTGVAGLAKKYNIPVVAFSGSVTGDAEICNEYGIDAFFPVLRKPCTLSEAMDKDNAYNNLKDTAKQVFRLIKTFK